MINAGAAAVPLGVTSPVPMAGFAARTALSTGEHDELTARAIALGPIVLITVDVCALEESTCAAVAQRVRVHGAEHAVVMATHTHAGPSSTPTRLTPCTRQVEACIVDAAVAAGEAALDARVLSTVHYAQARGAGIASNRRHQDRTVDPPVQMVEFRRIDGAGETHAVLATYPCHPVVLDGSNTLLSADYTHPLREALEATHPGAIAVFATGCAGDVNTGHSAEASYSLNSNSTRTFANAQRIGEQIAATILAAQTQEIPAKDVNWSASAVTVRMDLASPQQIAQDIASWEAQLLDAEPGQQQLLRIWLDWARTVGRNASGCDHEEWTGQVSAIRLGPLTLCTLPGEPFLAAAETIAADVEGLCMVLGYADGCPGYFPTLDEHPYGGYEVEDAHRYYGMPGPFSPGAAEVIIQEALSRCRAIA